MRKLIQELHLDDPGKHEQPKDKSLLTKSGEALLAGALILAPSSVKAGEFIQVGDARDTATKTQPQQEVISVQQDHTTGESITVTATQGNVFTEEQTRPRRVAEGAVDKPVILDGFVIPPKPKIRPRPSAPLEAEPVKPALSSEDVVPQESKKAQASAPVEAEKQQPEQKSVAQNPTAESEANRARLLYIPFTVDSSGGARGEVEELMLMFLRQKLTGAADIEKNSKPNNKKDAVRVSFGFRVLEPLPAKQDQVVVQNETNQAMDAVFGELISAGQRQADRKGRIAGAIAGIVLRPARTGARETIRTTEASAVYPVTVSIDMKPEMGADSRSIRGVEGERYRKKFAGATNAIKPRTEFTVYLGLDSSRAGESGGVRCTLKGLGPRPDNLSPANVVIASDVTGGSPSDVVQQAIARLLVSNFAYQTPAHELFSAVREQTQRAFSELWSASVEYAAIPKPSN